MTEVYARESKESIEVVKTVRVALYHNGKFLLLQKAADSKNPGALEFPGGKVESSDEEEGLRQEIFQETGLSIPESLPAQFVEEYSYYFEAGAKKKRYLRKVRLYLIRLPGKESVKIQVNQTKNEYGASEDKHDGFVWLSPQQLKKKITRMEKDPQTGERRIPVSRNSRGGIKKLLESVK